MVAFAVIVGLVSQLALAFSQPMVTVEQGTILGKTVHFKDEFIAIDKDLDVYLGVPFAEPPVGERRFAAPVPKMPWGDEVYNATYVRDICTQWTSYYTQSEDCLHLNIYVPNPKPSGASVIVYIHGGGYTSGSGYYSDGIPLSAVGDIIFVSINYRLSALGFLTTDDEASPGNYAMLDHIEALRWVKTNIEAFGGDANKITLAGESAGGDAVSAHLFSPLSQDLFEQAIIMSGSFLSPWSFLPDRQVLREQAFKLGAAVGCSTSDSNELISCLRQREARLIYHAASEIGFNQSPSVDRNFMLEPPQTLFDKNNFKKVPLMSGFNEAEGTLMMLYSDFGYPYYNSTQPPFVSKEDFEKGLNDLMYGYKSDLIFDSVQQEYVNWSKADDPEADYFDEYKYFNGDYYFSCPSIKEIRGHALDDSFEAYQYFYTHIPSVSVFMENENYGPKWLGAGHSEANQFVFGYPFGTSTQLAFHEYPEKEKVLSLNLMRYWTNFAKTGNPNKESSSSLPYSDERAWPAFTVPELQYKELAVNLTGGNALKADECHFWNNYEPQLITFAADIAETERQWREEFYTWKYTDMEDWRDAFDEYQEAVN